MAADVVGLCVISFSYRPAEIRFTDPLNTHRHVERYSLCHVQNPVHGHENKYMKASVNLRDASAFSGFIN